MALYSADRAQVDDGAEDTQGFPGGSVVKKKNPPAKAEKAREAVSIPGSGRSPGGANGHSLVFLPGKSHGQRGLEGRSSWGCKELDMTEHAQGRHTRRC